MSLQVIKKILEHPVSSKGRIILKKSCMKYSSNAKSSSADSIYIWKNDEQNADNQSQTLTSFPFSNESNIENVSFDKMVKITSRVDLNNYHIIPVNYFNENLLHLDLFYTIPLKTSASSKYPMPSEARCETKCSSKEKSQAVSPSPAHESICLKIQKCSTSLPKCKSKTEYSQEQKRDFGGFPPPKCPPTCPPKCPPPCPPKSPPPCPPKSPPPCPPKSPPPCPPKCPPPCPPPKKKCCTSSSNEPLELPKICKISQAKCPPASPPLCQEIKTSPHPSGPAPAQCSCPPPKPKTTAKPKCS